MKKAFVIIRVSGEDQLKGYGPDVQWEDDVIPNAPLLGLEVDENLKRVIQESATSWERVKFEATVKEALVLYHQGKIEALLFPRVDRETRFVFGSLPLLAEVVQSGLEVCFARERLHLDPNDSESVERYLSKATQAQAYVETMKQNTMRGKRRRVLQDGKLPSGRGVLYGYNYDKQQEKNIANACLDVVRMMGMWVLEEGIFLNEVCRCLKDKEGIPAPKGGLIWSRSTVGRILRNPAYAGKSYAGKTATVNGKRIRQPRDKWVETPEAVDKTAFTWEEWEGIQRQLDRNMEMSPRNQKLNYLLRRITYCKNCGRRFYGVPLHGKPYYRCKGRNRLAYPDPCQSGTINARWLENTVWSEVEKQLKQPEIMMAELRRQQETGENAAHLQEQLTQLNRQLDEYDEALARYLRIYGAGLYSHEKLDNEVNRVKVEQEKKIAEKDSLEKRLEEAQGHEVDYAQVQEVLKRMALNIENASFEDKRLALEMLNIKVWVDKGSVTIEGALPILDGFTVLQHS